MKKKITSLMLALIVALTLAVPAFATDGSSFSEVPNTTEEILSRFDSIITENNFETITLSDGTITQYTASNGDIVHVTELGNGNTRYEYYCRANETIYSYVQNSDLVSASLQNELVLDTFDVAAYREANKTMHELTDAEEDEIREIMTNENSQEECQQQLNEAGYEDVVVEDIDGITVASTNTNALTRAGIKVVNPTQESVNTYCPSYSWRISDSTLTYNNILARNIQCRVYEFADNFVEKTMNLTYVSVGVTVLAAAATCYVSAPLFATIISWAGVAVSTAGILESFQFIDEQSYTYVAEKSGWTYDYISPSANGRHSGYAICYYNNTLGKITMGFDGTRERTNFHWAQVNPGIGDIYDLDDSYILNRAYQIYSSAVILDGSYNAGYDGRLL